MTNNNQTEAIDLLTKLVSIPSPSEHEARASTYLAGWLNAHGLQAYVDEAGNAVGVKGAGPQEILLLGHIDTFPGQLPVRREGDTLYGRGSVDAKGPLCTFAAAAAQVEVPDGWRITVVGAVEEECASSKGARHILAQRLAHPPESKSKGTGTQRNKGTQTQSPISTRSVQSPPAYCIIGEPSHWDRVTLGYKGRLLMDVVMRIPFTHSAGEERLPAEQAIDFWHEVETLCFEFNILTEADTPFSRLDPSLRHIAHRDAGAFGEVEMSMGFRLPMGLTPVALEQKLCSLTYILSKGTSIDIQFSGGEMAYKGDKANPLVRAFLKGIRAEGGTPRFVVKTGTADMNLVAPHWPDTPIVAYGPGDSSLDHTPDEHIDLPEYLQAIAVLQETLSFLMSS